MDTKYRDALDWVQMNADEPEKGCVCQSCDYKKRIRDQLLEALAIAERVQQEPGGEVVWAGEMAREINVWSMEDGLRAAFKSMIAQMLTELREKAK